MSNRATVRKKKDGSGSLVNVQTEIATQPGVVVCDEWIDPATSEAVEIENGEVKRFPSIPQLADVLIRAGRFRVFNGQLVVSNIERIG